MQVIVIKVYLLISNKFRILLDSIVHMFFFLEGGMRSNKSSLAVGYSIINPILIYTIVAPLLPFCFGGGRSLTLTKHNFTDSNIIKYHCLT